MTEPTVDETTPKRKCCAGCRFEGVEMAQGYNILGTARGPLVMSNIFLSTALIYLASDEVGCLEETINPNNNATSLVVMDNCQEQVYGAFRPEALISNIAAISGVLSALFMPMIGAIVDFTPRRWMVGVTSAVMLVVIQAIQIGTTSATWFPMSILQAIAGFIFQIQVLAVYAYLPDISHVVGQARMTKYTSVFTMTQFSCQALFLLVIVGLSIVFKWKDVMTAQVSQAINATTIAISFFCGWRLLPKVPARNVLPDGANLLLQGFVQNWNTAKRVNRDFKKGLRWYMLALCFAEAASNAFTTVAVVFLQGQLGLSGTQVGIFFLIALVAMVPGGMLGRCVTLRTNPNTSWRLSQIGLVAMAIVGGTTLTKENLMPGGYLWGFCVGLCLGWFYPTENLFFSMIIPKGQEAELAGFFVYCTQIIGWLPPLVFSILVENDVDQGIGLIVTSAFAIVSVIILSMASSWPEIIDDVRSKDVTNDKPEDTLKTADESSPTNAGVPVVKVASNSVEMIH